MSTTYTLPMSTSNSFVHGNSHGRTGSHNRSTQSNRLAPPFALPRIPSESIVTRENHQLSHDHDHGHAGHDHDHAHDHNHESHQHNQNSFTANHLIPSPELDVNGEQRVGKRKNSLKTAHATSAHRHVHRNVSRPTELLLHSTENYSLLHGILADDESRRIFYFMLLNLSFMLVQSTYGFLTGSLGLISDSIHMFFDCVALLVGLCAAVMSKWPPSVKFPYGYGKIDTLAGLGNGIFLMLISVEITYEAMERLFANAEVARTKELLVVSTVGLLVNCVGIFAFHGHHGHGHGDSHDHNHSHDHSNSKAPDHKHNHGHIHHGHKHKHSNSNELVTACSSPSKATNKAAGGHHHHMSENMEGIYLHIMADALGSVSVVVSTLLIQLTGWSGWDPIASCLIAILIFASVVPLVRSTTKILLLSLDSDVEYNLRDILAGVSSISGVIGHTVPKFWMEDAKKEAGHHHGHSHSHAHGHEHGHDQKQPLGGHSCDDDPTVLGVIHVVASQHADLEDVKLRVSQYMDARKMNIVVQVEREGEGKCWCGGGTKTG